MSKQQYPERLYIDLHTVQPIEYEPDQIFNMVRLFNQRLKELNPDSRRMPDWPEALTYKDIHKHADMIMSELDEFRWESGRDIGLCADALYDIIFVAMGALADMGMPYTAGMLQVCRANLTKVQEGVPVIDGKLQKPKDFHAPATGAIVEYLSSMRWAKQRVIEDIEQENAKLLEEQRLKEQLLEAQRMEEQSQAEPGQAEPDLT